jgi:hypothetical protein
LRINTQGSQFVFNLPSDLVPKSILERYIPLLEKNWIQYENVLDYLNSTIKEISYPGLSLTLPDQTLHYGKKRNYKPVTNINDIATTREISVIFRRVDSDLNYWIMYDLFTNVYLNTTDTFINPFQVIALDIHRDAIYSINFSEIVLSNLSEIVFAYNQQRFNEQTFTLTFNYNFLDVEFILNQDQILQITAEEIPVIKQKNFNNGDPSKINP